MSNYDDSYSGTLGKNPKHEENPKAPNYKGKIKIDGKLHWLSGWVRVGQDGEKFISLKAEVAEQRQEQRRPAPRRDADDDSVPF